MESRPNQGSGHEAVPGQIYLITQKSGLITERRIATQDKHRRDANALLKQQKENLANNCREDLG